MTARQSTPLVVLVLLLIGAACVSVRTGFRHNAPAARGDTNWKLTYIADFHARKAGAVLRVALPENTPYARVAERRVEPNWEMVQHPSANTDKHDMVLQAPRAGQLRAVVEFDLQLNDRGGWEAEPPEVKLPVKVRAKCLDDEKGIQVRSPVVTDVLKELHAEQRDREELIERIFDHCSVDILPGGADAPLDAAGALAGPNPTARPLGRARALVALCRASKIPARLVTGFEVKIGSNVEPHTWVEIFMDNRWEPYDPQNGFPREVPRNFIPIRRGDLELVRGEQEAITDLTVRYAIARTPAPPGTFDLTRRRLVDVFDLTRLPIQIHEVLELLLLLPLGALVTAFFRTIVGVRTFGTFTPTLVALAFVYNHWSTGIVVFVTVLLLGLTSRALLDKLKLLLVPRLGIMLTLVVLCMVFGVSLLAYFDLARSAKMVLLPMVILTMMIERFYVTSEEDSVRFAFQLFAGTMALAFCVYLLLSWSAVGRMMLIYPELHCFTVVAMILIGRYTGYRLTELWRFRDVVETGRKGP